MPIKKKYLHPFLDSDRWKNYHPRNDDIIIATPFKSGTTWVQMIVLGLLHGIEKPPLMKEVGHWVDFRLEPQENMLERLENQTSRRFIKTHLPFDAIEFYARIKYIVVDRDPRDVGMSLWNHYQNMDVDLVNRNLPAGVHPVPPCPESIQEFWETWLTRGYFEWEREGYPFWSNLRHVQSWFDGRNLENVLHVHYNNLLLNAAAEISRIAEFLGLELKKVEIEAIANYTSFDNTKQNLDKLFQGGYKLFKEGADTFFHKGVNGRWKNVLSKSDEDLFQRVSSSILSDECVQWLTNGKLYR